MKKAMWLTCKTIQADQATQLPMMKIQPIVQLRVKFEDANIDPNIVL
jgi:hypothetical protein